MSEVVLSSWRRGEALLPIHNSFIKKMYQCLCTSDLKARSIDDEVTSTYFIDNIPVGHVPDIKPNMVIW